MSLPEPGAEHNAPEHPAIKLARKFVKDGLKDQEVLLRGKTRKKLTEEAKFALAQSYYAQGHSEIADDEIIELCTTLINLLYPDMEREEEPEAPDPPEPDSHDREASWTQEYHHPQRPPSASTAPLPPAQPPPSPFVDCVLCFHCEKYYWGQLILRSARCLLCGRGNLRPVSTWDLRTQSKPPFHSQGGAA